MSYPVICSQCKGPMVRNGWHLDCAGFCDERIEWAFGPTKPEPIIAWIGSEQMLIGHIRVPDLEARARSGDAA
jgi:hypothetical protein